MGGGGAAGARDPREVSFGSSAPWSLGVEEELFLVDRETLDAAPVFSRAVPEPTERIKPEVFECLVELATPVCADAFELMHELQRLRIEADALAGPHRATVVAIGTHPLASTDGQPIVPVERYERMAAELGERLRRQLVCGLHVHVSVPGPEACLRAFEGVVPWLPVLLALSANSPFVECAPTGRRSERAVRLLEMPTGGTPPLLASWDDWERATAGDERRRHWDAWPRPAYGTLEVRVCDQQSSVLRSVEIAAVVQALVATVADREREPYDRELYMRRRDAATRQAPDPTELAALADFLEPAATTLGSWDLVVGLLARPPEAERQLALGPEAALREAAGRSLEFARR
jgi:glutamate---cysteine ligase / carboxylate-amine ligase